MCVFNWDILVSCENITQVSVCFDRVLWDTWKQKTCCLSRQRIFLISYRGLFLRCQEWSLTRKVNSSPMNYSGGSAEKVRWVTFRYFPCTCNTLFTLRGSSWSVVFNLPKVSFKCDVYLIYVRGLLIFSPLYVYDENVFHNISHQGCC